MMSVDEAVQGEGGQWSPAMDVQWLQGFEVRSAASLHRQWIDHMTSKAKAPTPG